MAKDININNVIRIETKIGMEFFKKWLEFILPFHHMTPKEMDIVSAYLYKRYQLSAAIKDYDLLDRVTMGSDFRDEVRSLCDMSLNQFQVLLCKLRKRGIFVNDRIHPKLIPNLVADNTTGSFKLLLLFDFKEEPQGAEVETESQNEEMGEAVQTVR